MGKAGVAWRTKPKVTKEALTTDLRRLGLAQGSVVLVHSSLSRLGHVIGGAETVIDALLEAVGPEGTVLFPTLTGSPQDGPNYPPGMDVRTTPCWTGRIPETARLRPAVRRSLHPTHSVAAIGAECERYTAGHEEGISPCDKRSPYYRMMTEGGQILLLGGVTQQSNTSLHCIEELAGVPYHLQPDFTACRVFDARGKEHYVRNRLHSWRLPPDFLKVEAVFAAAGRLRTGQVGQAPARLTPAGALPELLLPLLQADPLYLLSDDARREFEREIT